MIIKEAIKNGYYREGENWYRERRFKYKGKSYIRKQLLFKIICKICGNISITQSRNTKTCSQSCHFKQFKGIKNHKWKGGGMTGDGYKWIYDFGNPMADSRGRVREHRYIMSKKIGRPLTRFEEIHHINGNKLDNRIENMILVSKSEHMSIHEKDRIKKRIRDSKGRFTS